MKNIALGRYINLSTFLHRLDPRFKLVAMIGCMIPIFFRFSSYAMTFFVYGVIFLLFYGLMRIARIRLKQLFTSLKAMWFMMLFLFIINLFFVRTGDFFVIPGIQLTIYYDAIFMTLTVVVRLMLMLTLTLLLTSTTKPMDLTYALEWWMTPLKWLKIPVHIFAMVIALTLRLIPTLLEETDRIMKAQASRGVDYENGKIREKVRAMVSLVIPLLASSIQRSLELADAMDARGYDPGAKRTRYRVLHWQKRDTCSTLLLVVFLGGMIVLFVTGFDVFHFLGGL